MSNGTTTTFDWRLSKGPGRFGVAAFVGIVAIGAAYVLRHMSGDLAHVETPDWLPFALLGTALLIALGFEFVNGFHDTANAVATVIYTHSLEPPVAVVWSGVWNFLGVMASTGAVAFGIVSLLPVELILQVGSTAGFAMIFALLIAAITWNLGTWYLGLPSSSSHTLIGSIMGVGMANQLMAHGSGVSGVDWHQAGNIGRALLISPIIGFACAGLLLVLARRLVKNPALYAAPTNGEPPPFWIRSLLILTCTGVSFAHGSNDGQKGMGLIMLILIGTVPTAYALNRSVLPQETQAFIAASQDTSQILGRFTPDITPEPAARPRLTEFVRSHTPTADTLPALRGMVTGIGAQLVTYRELSRVPPAEVRNLRNDMYIVSEALKQVTASGQLGALPPADAATLQTYRRHVDHATKFIPGWVKVAVALALGLGTMVGWRRIVVTVGEKIGKTHLTYAQGASAELTAMVTISAADAFGMPVSTTHVLSSAIAGTMAANNSGIQWQTIRKLVLAWTLTLPASILLAGTLFWAFRMLSGS